jgi:hypothetical protein
MACLALLPIRVKWIDRPAARVQIEDVAVRTFRVQSLLARPGELDER